jgi:hypothetical protein
LIDLLYVLLLSTLGSTLPNSPLNIIHQSQCGGKKSSTKLEILFQNDIIPDMIWIVFLIQLLHDVFVFKLDIIDIKIHGFYLSLYVSSI